MLLVYSMIDESSFEEMGRWLSEMRENLGNDVVIHVVGTKSDLVAQEPSLRKIPFERCIAYVAENLYPQKASTPLFPSGSARSSGFWGQEVGKSLRSDISLILTPIWILGHTSRVYSQPCLVTPSFERRDTDFENVKAGTVAMRSVHQAEKVLKRCSVSLQGSLLNRRTRRSRNTYKTAITHRVRKQVGVATLMAFRMSKEALS